MTGQKRWRTLLIGSGLIVLVNALALSGVAYNRSGEPDSLLRLSERELRPMKSRWLTPEQGDMVLTLIWRVLPAQGSPDVHYEYDGWLSFGGSPNWLDQRKMQTLGFELPDSAPITPAMVHRQRSREVLLVLELDGPTYQQALNFARRRHDEENRLRAANPEKKEFVHRSDEAKKRLQREETQNSRLFVVDAGLDATTLRAQYPDRTRYPIVGGHIYAQWRNDRPQPTLSGHIGRLTIDEISVPLELRPAGSDIRLLYQATPFQATVAFGKRREPWLRDIHIGSETR